MFAGLVGMRDALMYIQQIYLESHSYPEELENLIDEKSIRNHTIGKLKLVRFFFYKCTARLPYPLEDLEK